MTTNPSTPVLQGDNLIQNGDFQDLSGGTGKGSTPAGWSTNNGEGGVFFSNTRVEGAGFALGGWSGQAGQELSQTVTTDPGQAYSLTFSTGYVSALSGAELHVIVEDSAGTRVLKTMGQDVLAPHDSVPQTVQFTAEDSTTKVTFAFVGEGYVHGDIDLDNISLHALSDGSNVITVTESEAAGDLEKLDNGDLSILQNDASDRDIVTVNGVEGTVGTWIELDKGRVMINADGTVDFDADGDFESLNDGESETLTITYTLAEASNLLVNGNFESTDGFGGAGWGLLSRDTSLLEGWDVSGATRVELVDNNVRHASGEGNYALDIETVRGDDLTISQAVQGLQDGTSYSLSFMASRGYRSSNDESVEVYWNGELVLTADPDGREFETFTVDLIAGAGDGSDTLSVTSAGNQDNYGVYLDDFKLEPTDPATTTIVVSVQGETDYVAQDDTITVTEKEAAGDLETLDSGKSSILVNDMNGQSVVTVNGQTGNVGAWIELDKGRVMVNADGTVDFDADGDFDALNDGESEEVTLAYSIGTNVTENLIVNGTFEDHGTLNRNGAHGDKWDVFDTITGWTTPQGLLEIQEGRHGGTPDNPGFNSVVELDSHDSDMTNAGIAQEVQIAEAGEYTLSFDYAPRSRGNLTAETSELIVMVDDAVVETISSDELAYNRYEITLTLDAGTTVIGFTGGGVDDSYGPLLDNVELVGRVAETAEVTVKVLGETDTGSIAGRYFEDLDGDGLLARVDGAVGGQQVVVLNPDGTVFKDADGKIFVATTDNATGEYSIDDLPAGSYKLGFSLERGKAFVTKGEDLDGDGLADDSSASSVNEDTGIVTVTVDGFPITLSTTDVIEVTGGAALVDVNAGVAIPNTPPEAMDDFGPEFTSLDFSENPFGADGLPVFGVNILDNDSDADGDAITIVRAGNDTTADADGWFDWQDADNGGQIRINQSGEYLVRDVDGDTASLAEGVSIQTGLEYEIADGNGGTDTAMAYFDVIGAVLEDDGSGGGGGDFDNPFGGGDFGDPFGGNTDPSDPGAGMGSGSGSGSDNGGQVPIVGGGDFSDPFGSNSDASNPF